MKGDDSRNKTAQLSASQTRQQALANADHLAILHAMWTDQVTAAREQRYRDLLLASLRTS
jgi:hypothetical protein